MGITQDLYTSLKIKLNMARKNKLIVISEETWRTLQILKIKFGYPSLDALLKDLSLPLAEVISSELGKSLPLPNLKFKIFETEIKAEIGQKEKEI